MVRLILEITLPAGLPGSAQDKLLRPALNEKKPTTFFAGFWLPLPGFPTNRDLTPSDPLINPARAGR